MPFRPIHLCLSHQDRGLRAQMRPLTHSTTQQLTSSYQPNSTSTYTHCMYLPTSHRELHDIQYNTQLSVKNTEHQYASMR